MIVEVTPAIVSAVSGTLVVLGGALFALGNLQWWTRKEGNALLVTVATQAKTLENLSSLRQGMENEAAKREELDRNAHRRMDAMAEKLDRLIGASEGGKS